MEAGVCQYDNELIFVDGNDMKSWIPSFAGKEVTVEHEKTDASAIPEKDGIVSDCFYNELDGWLWSKILVWTKEAQDAISKGWVVSNSYLPIKTEGAGSYHNLDYNRKIVTANFTGLAIVPNPRYENALILTPDAFKTYQERLKNELKELHNSKGAKKMFKLFKNKQEEVTSIDTETMVELENGQSMAIGEMINAIKKNAEKEEAETKEEEAEKCNEDSEVDVDGEKMPVKELVNRYKAMAKKNADDEADKAEKEGEKEKENSKHFDELLNARSNVKPETKAIYTADDMDALGKARYGALTN
jgi:hypothetical protein